MRTRDAIAVLALLSPLALAAGCSNDDEDLRRAIEQSRGGPGVPATAVGGGTEEGTGLPVGYPLGLQYVRVLDPLWR